MEIKSDMATNEASMDVQREEDNKECVPTGRTRNIVMNRIRGGGGLRSPAPNNPGQGLLAFAWGREWRSASFFYKVRLDNLPQAFGGGVLGAQSPPHLGIAQPLVGRARALAQLWERADAERVRTVNSQQSPRTP